MGIGGATAPPPITEDVMIPAIPAVLPAIAIAPNPVFVTHPFCVFFYVSARWCQEVGVRDEEIRKCIAGLEVHREGDISPTGRVDFCDRCCGNTGGGGGGGSSGGLPAGAPPGAAPGAKKPLVRIGITGLRTVRNPVAVVPAGTVPEAGGAHPDVLCYVYDSCKAGCTTSRLHIKSRLVLVGSLPHTDEPVVSEPFVIMARDKPRKTPRKLAPPVDETGAATKPRKSRSSLGAALASAGAEEDAEYDEEEEPGKKKPKRKGDRSSPLTVAPPPPDIFGGAPPAAAGTDVRTLPQPRAAIDSQSAADAAMLAEVMSRRAASPVAPTMLPPLQPPRALQSETMVAPVPVCTECYDHINQKQPQPPGGLGAPSLVGISSLGIPQFSASVMQPLDQLKPL